MLGGDLTFINVTAEGLAWDRGENHTVGSDGGGGGALVKAFGRQAESSQIKLSPLKLRLSNNQVPRLSMDDPWLTRVRQVLPFPTSATMTTCHCGVYHDAVYTYVQMCMQSVCNLVPCFLTAGSFKACRVAWLTVG